MVGKRDEGLLVLQERAFDRLGPLFVHAQGDILPDFDLEAVLHLLQPHTLLAVDGLRRGDLLLLCGDLGLELLVLRAAAGKQQADRKEENRSVRGLHRSNPFALSRT